MLYKLFMWRKEFWLFDLETLSSTPSPLWNYCDSSFMSFSNLHIIKFFSASWRGAVPTFCPGGLSVAESSVIRVSNSVLGNKTEQRKDLYRECSSKPPILRAPVSPSAAYFRTFRVSRKAFQQIWFLFETIFSSFVTCAW